MDKLRFSIRELFLTTNLFALGSFLLAVAIRGEHLNGVVFSAYVAPAILSYSVGFGVPLHRKTTSLGVGLLIVVAVALLIPAIHPFRAVP